MHCSLEGSICHLGSPDRVQVDSLMKAACVTYCSWCQCRQVGSWNKKEITVVY